MHFAPTTLTILFGTETGTASSLADWGVRAAALSNVRSRAVDMATYNTFKLSSERDLLIICSTHGEGEPPQTAGDFFEYVFETDAPLLGVRYAVLALGDSGYEDFCAAGKSLDRRFEELGATRLASRLDVDVGELTIAREWIVNFVELVAMTTSSRGKAACH